MDEGRDFMLTTTATARENPPRYSMTVRTVNAKEFCPAARYVAVEMPDGWYAEYKGQKHSAAVKVEVKEGTNEETLEVHPENPGEVDWPPRPMSRRDRPFERARRRNNKRETGGVKALWSGKSTGRW